MRRDRWIEVLLIALFAACVSFQLFVPPSVGMANNGDFARLIGRFSLGPENRDSVEDYHYFTTHWIYDRSYQWVSDNFSSELIPISGALLFGWIFDSHHFDIRILGAIHALLWIGCFAALLVVLRRLQGWRRWTVAGAALFIFADANYVAFFNSFYMDTAAVLFLAWAVVLWTLIVTRREQSLWLYVAFCIASALCAMSKSQHAPLGVVLFLLAVLAAVSFEGVKLRWVGSAIALIIPLAAWAEYHFMPATDARMPQYAVVFRKILENSKSPADDLRELGLGPEFSRYVGQDRPPLTDVNAEEKWWAEFLGQATRGRVLLFHSRHPWRTLSMMHWDLRVRGADRRMEILGKYERAAGFPASYQVRSFGWWTSFRSALIRIAPWHIPVWFEAVSATSIWLMIRYRSALATLSLALSIMAIMEFAICSLSDAGETERHLFLFHVLTDFTVLFAVAEILQVFHLARLPSLFRSEQN